MVKKTTYGHLLVVNEKDNAHKTFDFTRHQEYAVMGSKMPLKGRINNDLFILLLAIEGH